MNLTQRDRTLAYGLTVAVIFQTLDWWLGVVPPYASIPSAILLFLVFKGLNAIFLPVTIKN